MKRSKPRAKSAVRPAPVAPPPPEKPFLLLVFGFVCAAAVSAGCVLNLIRPFRPLTVGPFLFLLAAAVLAGWMAWCYGRGVAGRVRQWRATLSSRPRT